MPGRPPLPIGSHGKITTKDVTPAGERVKVWQSVTYFRDHDGKTRRVLRTGHTKSGAENSLRAALLERARGTSDGIVTPDTRLRDVADAWFEQRATEVEEGKITATTLEQYRRFYRRHIEGPLGDLRVREATTVRCEAWQRDLRKSKGSSTAKSSRAVLSGILGYAARMGALPTNPTRDLSVIGGKPKRQARALDQGERASWLEAMEDHARHEAAVEAAQLAGDEAALVEARARLRVARKAQRWDLPDLTRLMLATSARIGEALAVGWDDVDFDAGTVWVRHHLVRLDEVGLVRADGTKRGPGRLLRVPGWTVAMLLSRRTDPRSGYPVFPDAFGGWRDPSNVRRVIREVRKTFGHGELVSHDFRKTSLTALDAAGLSPRVVADVAGHADPSMTQKVYMVRGLAAGADEAAAALEDLL